MARTKKTPEVVPTRVSVRYDLLDLPTAQHRAGLAGLVLQVESMKERGIAAESIPLVEVKDATTVEATFSEASLRGLFDDLYDAKLVERSFAEKLKNKKPKRVELDLSGGAAMELVDEEDESDEPDAEESQLPGSTRARSRKRYIYDMTEPCGHFLRKFTDDGKEIWHKLWREMLWAIPRAKSRTRLPFDKRAKGKSSDEGEAAWKEMLALEKKKRKNEVHTCEVSGAILLGAQVVSAESVPFRDRADHALLLHFWQLTVRIFVPEQIDADGKRDFAGYVIAVPEVGDVPQFIRRYKRAMEDLPPKANGYRPSAAVISLPAQGALEFMESLAQLAGQATSAERSDIARALAGVEFHHMVKIRHNVKMMLHGRVPATAALLTEYESVKATSQNPMFRAGRLLALLRDEPWYAEFKAMMAERPWPLFVQAEKTPRTIPSFARDVTCRFQSRLRSEQTRREYNMTTGSSSPPAKLETLVYRLVRTYVRAKTEQRSGITYESFKDKRVKDEKGRERVEYPQKYTEAQQQVCSDLFLGLRSRRDDDFVTYFTGTVGSVAQGPNLSDEADYTLIAQALLDEERRGYVQTLAMLAASAASFAARSADESEPTDTEEDAQ